MCSTSLSRDYRSHPMTKRLFKLKEILKHIYQDYQLDWIGLYRIMSNVDHVEKGLVKEVLSILMTNMLLGLYRRNESIRLSTHYRLYLKEYSDVHRDDRTSFLFGWHSRPYQTICILFHDSNESIVYFAKYPYSLRILHFAHLFYIFRLPLSLSFLHYSTLMDPISPDALIPVATISLSWLSLYSFN